MAKGNTIYLIKNGGQLSCVDVESGEIIQGCEPRGELISITPDRQRPPVLLPVMAVSVVKITDRPTIVSVNEMEENVRHPAIVDSVIYLRTHLNSSRLENRNGEVIFRRSLISIFVISFLSGYGQCGKSH